MKKIINLVCHLACLFSITQIQSCKKNDLKELENYKPCSIEKIVFYGEVYNTIDSAMFTYNAQGNPTEIKVSNTGTGSPNYLFKYDRKNRLKEAIYYYRGFSTQQWFFYFYGPDNRIVTDTSYTFTTYNDEGIPPAVYNSKYIHRYSYDAMGRISRIETAEAKPILMELSMQTYNYDSDGNLLNGRVYDKKVNFNRTNKIWQFVNRDYSVNNPVTAINYNPYLPLSFRNTGYYGPYFLNIPLTKADLYYNCNFPGIKLPNISIKTP